MVSVAVIIREHTNALATQSTKMHIIIDCFCLAADYQQVCDTRLPVCVCLCIRVANSICDVFLRLSYYIFTVRE